MSGFIYLCGPSGAGKDSLFAFARARVEGEPRLRFAQRLMTRPAEPGSPHRSLGAEQFEALEREGGLCLSWSAHGYRYGVAREAADLVAGGLWVMLSGSRESALGLRGLFPSSKVVLVTAPEQVLEDRLLRRGREAAEAVAERQSRNRLFAELAPDLVLENSGVLEKPGMELVRCILGWLAEP